MSYSSRAFWKCNYTKKSLKFMALIFLPRSKDVLNIIINEGLLCSDIPSKSNLKGEFC